MKMNDLKIVIDVLKERSLSLQDRVESLQLYDAKLDKLLENVRRCDLSEDSKYDIENLLMNTQAETCMEYFSLNSKISSIDSFVSDIEKSMLDNDDDLIYIELERDINV